MIALTVIAETAGTITVAWQPVTGAIGYEFLVDATRVSNTWDPTVKQTRFAKPTDGEHTYSVVALAKQDQGDLVWPAVTPPPPPPGFKVRGMYYAGAYDWAAIHSYGFNTLYCDVGDLATMKTIAAQGYKVWAQPGYYSNGKFSRPDAEVVTECKAAWATGAVDKFYLADEPTSGPDTIKARSDLIKQACPGAQTIISLWNTSLINGAFAHCTDAVALDGYPIQNGTTINPNVIPNQAKAADAAGWPYYGVIQAFTDGTATYPWPTPAQVQTMIDQWAATKQVGYIVYQWGGSAPMLQNKPDVLAVLKAANAVA